MQDTTRYPKPIPLDGFPLAASPKHVPDAIDDIPVIHPGSTWLFDRRRFGQMLLQKFPQLRRNTIWFRFLRFCAILFHGDGFLLSVDFGESCFSRSRLL